MLIMDEPRNHQRKKPFKEIPIQNPFLRDKFGHWSRENELFDKIKVSNCAITELTLCQFVNVMPVLCASKDFKKILLSIS